MALFNLNQLDPSMVKNHLHAIDGIIPEIAAAIGVSPPLLLFRAPDDEDGEEQPGDRLFEESGERPPLRGKGCCGQRCVWKFRIEGTIQQDTASLQLPTGGLVIRPKNATVMLVKAEG